jgi:hypothetical protein
MTINPETAIKISYVDATRNVRYGDDWLAAKDCIGGSTTGDLYRAMRREYGRCISRVYIDTNGQTLPIGWVFVSRQRYDDTREPYRREIWIMLHEHGERTIEGPAVAIQN